MRFFLWMSKSILDKVSYRRKIKKPKDDEQGDADVN